MENILIVMADHQSVLGEISECLNSCAEGRANNAESWFLLLMCAVLIF